MLERKTHGDPAAHRMSGNDRAVDVQSIEQPDEIADKGADRIGSRRLLGLAVAAHVGSNNAAASREEFDLWSPDLSGLRIPVHEDQRFPVAADVATQLGVPDRYAMDGQDVLVAGVPKSE